MPNLSDISQCDDRNTVCQTSPPLHSNSYPQSSVLACGLNRLNKRPNICMEAKEDGVYFEAAGMIQAPEESTEFSKMMKLKSWSSVRYNHNSLGLKASHFRYEEETKHRAVLSTPMEKSNNIESLWHWCFHLTFEKSCSSGNCAAQTLSKLQQPVKICVLPQILVCKDNPWIYIICMCRNSWLFFG